MEELDKTVVLRVLIAEDEPFQRESLEAMFKSVNSSLFGSVYFDARIVCSADEVLETLRTDVDWQLVMLDIVMPGRRGDEIIGDVRSILGEKVPLLMISAPGTQMAAVHRCLRLGADFFVAKPLHFNVIRNLWQHCMLKHPTLFDGLDELPGAAPEPPSPHQGVASSAPIIASEPCASCDTSRAAELVAQLEALNMTPESTAPNEEDPELALNEEDPGACKQQ
tara:strand:- start:218 stop:886 length:669 start_codon:yes stop_codon:yes gene_type:complete